MPIKSTSLRVVRKRNRVPAFAADDNFRVEFFAPPPPGFHGLESWVDLLMEPEPAERPWTPGPDLDPCTTGQPSPSRKSKSVVAMPRPLRKFSTPRQIKRAATMLVHPTAKFYTPGVLESEVDEHNVLDDNSDSRLRLLKQLIRGEKIFNAKLKLVISEFAEPMRCCGILSINDYNTIFNPVYDICSTSTAFLGQLEKFANDWSSDTKQIGVAFSERFFKQFEDYNQCLAAIKPALRQKRLTDSHFAEFCVEKSISVSGGETLTDLLLSPDRRVLEYHEWLQQILSKTSPDHPDMPNLKRAVQLLSDSTLIDRSKQQVDQTVNEQRLEHVESLFPGSKLQLLSKKKAWGSQGALDKRKAGASSINQMVFKSSKVPLCRNVSKISDSMQSTSKLNSTESFRRSYIKEGPAILTAGSHSCDRYLFLFNDLLLIAKEKERTANSYKLKEKIRLSEVWLKPADASCEAIIGESSSTSINSASSFVIGWPTVNYVIQFSNAQDRDGWFEILSQTIAAEKDREYPKITTVKVQCKDARVETKSSILSDKHDFNYATVLQINNQQSAQDLFCRALAHFGLANSEAEYQLWVYSDRESAPYALHGHESPFAILLSHVRDLLPEDSQEDLANGQMEDLANYHLYHKCLFAIRPKRAAHKKAKVKKSTTTSLVTQIKKRMMAKQESCDSALLPSPTGHLFGHSLGSLAAGAEGPAAVPKPIMEMFHHLLLEGVFCRGIFRMAPKATSIKELRERLDAGETICLSKTNPYVTASVLKDFLRSLPDSILVSERFNAWMAMVVLDDSTEKLKRAKQLLSQLPPANYELLRHLICLLHHVAAKQSENQMTSLNLAICFGYTLLLPQQELTMSESCKRIAEVTQLLIERAVDLFGPETPDLLGPVPDRPPSSQDSGEDSDSMGVLNKQDTSSVDSLIGVGPSPVGSRPPSSQPPQLFRGITLSKDSGLENPHTIDEQESEASSGFPRSMSQSEDTEEELYYSADHSLNCLGASGGIKRHSTMTSNDNLPGSLTIAVETSSPAPRKTLANSAEHRRRSRTAYGLGGSADADLSTYSSSGDLMSQSWCIGADDELSALAAKSPAAGPGSRKLSEKILSNESLIFEADSCFDLPALPNLPMTPRMGPTRSSKRANGCLHRSESGEHLVINETMEIPFEEQMMLKNSLRVAAQAKGKSGARPPLSKSMFLDQSSAGADATDGHKKANLTLTVPIDSSNDSTPPETSPSDRCETSASSYSSPISPFPSESELSRNSISRKAARHRKGPPPIGPVQDRANCSFGPSGGIGGPPGNSFDGECNNDSGAQSSIASSLSSLSSCVDEGSYYPSPRAANNRKKMPLSATSTISSDGGTPSEGSMPSPKLGAGQIQRRPTTLQVSSVSTSIVLHCNASNDESVTANVAQPSKSALTYIVGAGSNAAKTVVSPQKPHKSLARTSGVPASSGILPFRITVPDANGVNEVSNADSSRSQMLQGSVHYSPSAGQQQGASSSIVQVGTSPPLPKSNPRNSLSPLRSLGGGGQVSAHQALGILKSSPFIPYPEFVARLSSASAGSYDSSTVTEPSSEESTPHVSRENSRAQELEQKANQMFPQKSSTALSNANFILQAAGSENNAKFFVGPTGAEARNSGVLAPPITQTVGLSACERRSQTPFALVTQSQTDLPSLRYRESAAQTEQPSEQPPALMPRRRLSAQADRAKDALARFSKSTQTQIDSAAGDKKNLTRSSTDFDVSITSAAPNKAAKQLPTYEEALQRSANYHSPSRVSDSSQHSSPARRSSKESRDLPISTNQDQGNLREARDLNESANQGQAKSAGGRTGPSYPPERSLSSTSCESNTSSGPSSSNNNPNAVKPHCEIAISQAQHKLNIPVASGQVRHRIKRYDRENLRRKTLGGVDFAKSSDSSLEAESPPQARFLQRTNSYERIAELGGVTSKRRLYRPDEQRMIYVSGAAANQSEDSPANQNHPDYLNSRLPEVSWSVQKLRALYSPPKVAQQQGNATVQMQPQPVIQSSAFRPPLARHNNASIDVGYGNVSENRPKTQAPAIVRKISDQSIRIAVDDNKTKFANRYSSYDAPRLSAGGGNFSRQHSELVGYSSPYANPGRQQFDLNNNNSSNNRLLSHVAIVECNAGHNNNYPVLVPPPLPSNEKPQKCLRLSAPSGLLANQELPPHPVLLRNSGTRLSDNLRMHNSNAGYQHHHGNGAFASTSQLNSSFDGATSYGKSGENNNNGSRHSGSSGPHTTAPPGQFQQRRMNNLANNSLNDAAPTFMSYV